MPSWGEILKQLETYKSINPYDAIRRDYLKQLSDYTCRNTILYATSWTQNGPPWLVSIVDEDIQGFMEVIHGLEGDKLDLIIHSPGGDPGATEGLVSYLRAKFNHIRAIIPQGAMSAATMMACAADEIIMGKHSYLGPVDPQMILETPLGTRAVPAYSVLDQFNKAKEESKKDISALSAWYPTLEQYGPELLVECENAIELSKKLVYDWLDKYMFKDKNGNVREIADKLSDHTHLKSHNRHINYHDAKELGLNVKELEADQKLQDLVLSVFHAATITFNDTVAVKIIENQNGKIFIKGYSPPE